MSVRDRIARRAVPRLLIALSTVRWPGRAAAALRRTFGGRARVRLYLAFDDPYSAVALLGLAERLTHRRARLVVEPVVERGIPDDPAADAKRRYALVDARRLARRGGLELSRTEPLPAAATAFLARWAAAVPHGSGRTDFCVAAMRRLWFETDGPVDEAPYADLWHEHVVTEGTGPPVTPPAGGAEPRLRARRLYDTPAAVVHGQWFFAHERLDQVEHRLDELGWTAAA